MRVGKYAHGTDGTNVFGVGFKVQETFPDDVGRCFHIQNNVAGSFSTHFGLFLYPFTVGECPPLLG